mgnify:CR=1 FL=1
MTGLSSVASAAPAWAITPPDLEDYRHGGCGIPYVLIRESGQPGPRVVLNALTHGNELAGAIALDNLLRCGFRPQAGQVAFCFANVAALARFTPEQPYLARFVEEDLNRIWGGEPAPARQTQERQRAQALRPLYDQADFLLDLHSMHLDSPPLILAGVADRAVRFALQPGFPDWVIRDGGHAAGRRLIDYSRFADPGGTAVALLAECGYHGAAQTVSAAVRISLRFLVGAGAVSPAEGRRWLKAAGVGGAADLGLEPAPSSPSASPGASPRIPTVLQVIEAVTVQTGSFGFVREFANLESVPAAGTLIAQDGPRTIRTPCPECRLILPVARAGVGQTAVRFGRKVCLSSQNTP